MKSYKETIMYKEILETPIILNTLLKINGSTINNIRKEFNERGIKFAYVTGRGTSENALLFFRYLIGIKLGLAVDISSPSIITVYNSTMKYENALVIAVSQSGEAQDGIEVIKQANKNGALTIAVTNFKDSPLAKEAKYHLYLNCDREVSLAATKTFSAQLFTLSHLVYSLSNDDESLKTLSEVPKYIIKSFEELEKASDHLSESIKDVKDGFVITRGLTLSLAEETRVKMSETCYMRLQSFSSVSFYHGPLAMVDKGTFALIIASKIGPKNCNNKFRNVSFKECIDKLTALGSDVHVLTDNSELINENVEGYLFKSVLSEEFMIFIFTIVIQLATLKCSIKKGLDPDTPRSLKKVTLTK